MFFARHEVVREQIPGAKAVYIEVLAYLRFELVGIVPTTYYPVPQTGNCAFLIGGSIAPSNISREAELQTIVKLRHVACGEQAEQF